MDFKSLVWVIKDAVTVFSSEGWCLANPVFFAHQLNRVCLILSFHYILSLGLHQDHSLSLSQGSDSRVIGLDRSDGLGDTARDQLSLLLFLELQRLLIQALMLMLEGWREGSKCR